MSKANTTCDERGFTILETLVALALFASALLTLMHTQRTQAASISRLDRARTLSLLAASRLDDIRIGEERRDRGSFSEIDGATWTLRRTPWSLPGGLQLERLELTVVSDDDSWTLWVLEAPR